MTHLFDISGLGTDQLVSLMLRKSDHWIQIKVGLPRVSKPDMFLFFLSDYVGG